MNVTSMYQQHTEIFICPMSGQKLKFLEGHQLLKWNDLISRGEISDLTGQCIQTLLEQAFITEDENLLYPIYENILFLLPQSAYALGCDAKKWQIKDKNSALTQELKNFYNTEGWCFDGENYKDATDSEDLREISKHYISMCHRRVTKHLPNQGKYILDIASGPVQYDEYIDYSRQFNYRICADISIQALKQAQQRIGSQGLYVLCDITRLPFKTNTLDACVSLHTIYHVPESEQLRAFAQLHRVLKPAGKAVIVYSWGKNSFLMRGFLGPFRLIKCVLNFFRLRKAKQPIYFYAFNYKWFKRILMKRFQVDLYSWRSVNVPFMKIFIHRWVAGSLWLKLFLKLEERYPKLMGRIGAYPLFVIKKSSNVNYEPHKI